MLPKASIMKHASERASSAAVQYKWSFRYGMRYVCMRCGDFVFLFSSDITLRQPFLYLYFFIHGRHLRQL